MHKGKELIHLTQLSCYCNLLHICINIEIVKSIQSYLGISLPSVVLGNRSVKFELSFGLFAR